MRARFTRPLGCRVDIGSEPRAEGLAKGLVVRRVGEQFCAGWTVSAQAWRRPPRVSDLQPLLADVGVALAFMSSAKSARKS
jgi:hypothetical protein